MGFLLVLLNACHVGKVIKFPGGCMHVRHDLEKIACVPSLWPEMVVQVDIYFV